MREADSFLTFVRHRVAMRKYLKRGLLPTTVTILFVAGCSGSADNAQPDVASLQSAAAPQSNTALTSERPVIRPDATEADIQALERVFWKCLEGEGVPVLKAPDGNYQKPPNVLQVQKDHAAAFTKCAPLSPEGWMERERRVNPEYLDRLRDVVVCVKEKGFDVRLGGDPPNPMYSSNEEFMRAEATESECQKKAFSKRIEEQYKGK